MCAMTSTLWRHVESHGMVARLAPAIVEGVAQHHAREPCGARRLPQLVRQRVRHTDLTALMPKMG